MHAFVHVSYPAPKQIIRLAKKVLKAHVPTRRLGLMSGQGDETWGGGAWDPERLEPSRGKRSASVLAETDNRNTSTQPNKRRGPHVGCQVSKTISFGCKPLRCEQLAGTVSGSTPTQKHFSRSIVLLGDMEACVRTRCNFSTFDRSHKRALSVQLIPATVRSQLDFAQQSVCE